MEQHKQTDLQQFLSDKDSVRQLSQSAEAKALAEMLLKNRDSASLQAVAAQAVKGDTKQLAQLVRQLSESPQGSELLKKLGATLDTK